MRKLFWLDSPPSMMTRLLARGIDYCLFYLFLSLASMVFPFYIDDLYYFGLALGIPVFWAPLEAILISHYKTTPGKALFGVRVENHLAGRIPFWISLKRACFLGTRPGILRQKKISSKRFVIGLCAFLCLFGSSFFEKEVASITTGFEKYKPVDGWIAYTSTDGRFRVIFPEDPECESKVLPVPSQNKNLNYNELKSYHTKKVYYSVSYMELPRKWKMAGAKRLLQGALDLMAEYAPGTQILEKNMTKHKNLHALDFRLSQGEEETQGRLILVGTTLFRLTVVYPPSLAHQLQHQQFLDSFEVHS